jgi:hypothetical protein
VGSQPTAAVPAFLKVAIPEAAIPSQPSPERPAAGSMAQSRTRIPVRKGLVLEVEESFERPMLLAAILFVAGITR